jgi:hypothetical protein
VLATTRPKTSIQEISIACLLMRDQAQNAWQLVAIYD